MVKNEPILIVEDDHEDQEILKEVFESLQVKNELRFFVKGEQLIDYISTTTEQPFLIISDVNLIGMNGHDLKRKINENEKLRKKAIPFIFLTTTVDPLVLDKAYQMMVQGYFQKESTLEGIKNQLSTIIGYWTMCRHPNSAH